MNSFHTDNDTELIDAPVKSALNGHVVSDDVDDRDRGLIVARVIHHIGGGIRWNYNRNLAIAFAISLGVHVLVFSMYWLTTLGNEQPAARVISPLRSLTADTNYTIDVTPVKMMEERGGGGSVDSKAPEGLAKAGDPNAAPRYDPNKPDPSKTPKVFDPKSPRNIKVVDKSTDDRRVVTTDRDTSKTNSSGAGNKGQHPDGKGTTDAGGSGGLGVGIGVGNGIGSRGWIRRPQGGHSASLEASGQVILQCTVMPNGDITNIRPVKTAHASLVADAKRRLSAAKAKPLRDDEPQKPVTVQIPFTYNLK